MDNAELAVKVEYAGYAVGCLSQKNEEKDFWAVCRSQV
jgi:hypothetical protein